MPRLLPTVLLRGEGPITTVGEMMMGGHWMEMLKVQRQSGTYPNYAAAARHMWQQLGFKVSRATPTYFSITHCIRAVKLTSAHMEEDGTRRGEETTPRKRCGGTRRGLRPRCWLALHRCCRWLALAALGTAAANVLLHAPPVMFPGLLQRVLPRRILPGALQRSSGALRPGLSFSDELTAVRP